MQLIGKLKKKISLNHIQGFDSLFRSNLTNAIQRVHTFNKTIDHIVEIEDNTDSLLFGDISPCQVETVARLTVDLLISLTVTHSEVKRIENDLGRYCFVFTEMNAFTQKMLKNPDWGVTTYSNRVHSLFKRPAKGNTSREVDHNKIGFIPRLRKNHFKIKEII